MTPEQIARLPYRPCVGVMLINAEGLIFGGQRIDSTAPAWQMPQGGIDPGEVPQAAALRELREETGIGAALVDVVAEAPDTVHYDLPADLVPHIWKGRYRGQEQRWFLMRYLGTDDQINIRTDHPEFSEWRWLYAREMLDSIVPFKRAVYAQVIGQFGEYLA